MNTSHRSFWTRRRLPAVALGVLSISAVAVSLAWACTPISEMDQPAPGAGPAGTHVTINARSYNLAMGPEKTTATIYLDTIGGQVLGTARVNGSVTKTVTIPQATSGGVHYLVAVFERDNGTTQGKASQPFTVTVPGAAGGEAPGDGAAEDSPGAVQVPAGNGAPAPQATPTPNGQPGAQVPTRSEVGKPQAGGRAPLQSGPGTGRRAIERPGSGDPIADRGAGRGGGAVDGGATGSNGKVFAGSAAAGESTGQASAAAGRTGAREASGAGPSTATSSTEGSAAGDLWSGFDSADRGSLVVGAGDVGQSGDATGSAFSLGIGFLALGLIALFGGLSLVAVRRRRTVKARF